MDRNREQFKYVVQCRKVALRKESVDRNYGSDLTYSDGVGRSPQGERG